jgi:hypothetical protein
MGSSVIDVFASIARCPIVTATFEGNGGPCERIVRSQFPEQGTAEYRDFQVPEPWVGQIDVAPILFVSSNPSIGEDNHSRGDTPDAIIWESHHLAFGGGTREYIQDGIYTLDRDGKRIEAQHYWSWARARAGELIPGRPVRPGIDYAFTEVVHCKSKHQFGVAEAAPVCSGRYFKNVLSVAAARVVIAVGSFAQAQIFGVNVPPEDPIEMNLGGNARLVVALSHPSSFISGKTLSSRYSSETLARLIAAVASEPT